MSAEPKENTGELLRGLFEATAHATGNAFFKTLARHLAAALEVHVVFVSEVLEPHVSARTLAVVYKRRILPNFEYSLRATPCERVVGGDIVRIPERVYECYPAAGKGWRFRVESYLGIPLVGQSGEVIGHVVGLHDTPLRDKRHDFSTIEAFAVRATAELERHRVEQELGQAQLQLIQSEKMAALGQLTAGVAHELNTPLGVLKSNGDLIERHVSNLREVAGRTAGANGGLERSLKGLLDSVDANRMASERIAQIVENLGRFTRVDRADYENTNVKESIESAMVLLEPSLKEKIRIVRLYEDVPEVLSHPSELNQVFMTLLKNASEAIEDAGTITVRTFADRANVYAEIADDGRGIEAGELDRLFDVRFARKGKRVGMRLGLSTALHLIRKNDGDIRVSSQPGKGTRFTVRIPQKRRDQQMAPAASRRLGAQS